MYTCIYVVKITGSLNMLKLLLLYKIQKNSEKKVLWNNVDL